MTSNEIETWLLLNEPVFDYNGDTYSVCCVNGKFYTDGPNGDGEFAGFDDLISHWTLDGKLFADICEGIINT